MWHGCIRLAGTERGAGACHTWRSHQDSPPSFLSSGRSCDADATKMYMGPCYPLHELHSMSQDYSAIHSQITS